MTNSRELTFGYGLLICLTAAAPVLTISSGWLAPQLLTLAVGGLMFVLFRESDSDIRQVLKTGRRFMISILLPAAWIVFQLAPLPLGSIDHSIWGSAAAALSEPLAGHISIDLGYTLRGLFGYLAVGSLIFATMVLTRSREHAQTLLISLCTITSFAAIELLLLQSLQTRDSPRDMADALVSLVSFGAILNVAGIVRVAERYETRFSRPEQPLRSYIGIGSAALGGAILCLATLVYVTNSNTVIAVLFGLAFLCTIIVARRLHFGRWTTVTVFAAALVVCGGVVVLRSATSSSTSPILRFVSHTVTDEEPAAVMRMLADIDWTGTGVGTYRALTIVYRDGSGRPLPAPLNTVSSAILEWGYAGTAIMTLLILQIMAILLRGALSRGRDEFYAAGALGCLITMLCQTFCNPSLTHAAVQLLVAIIIGLGISQAFGHKSGPVA